MNKQPSFSLGSGKALSCGWKTEKLLVFQKEQ